jgi:hypothetical protein
MNENCRGCECLAKNKKECHYTHVGVIEFPNCVCSSCLIKTLCHDFCDDFYKMIYKEKDITDYRLDKFLLLRAFN